MKAVVFDLGNVLVEFGWRRFFEERGYKGESFERIVNATVRNPWWEELDKGTISKEEAVAHYIEKAPEYAEELSHLYEHIEDMLPRYSYTLDWLLELREKGCQIYILSNWSEPAFVACREHALRFLDDVDGAVISYQEKVIKPDLEIFRILCDRYQIHPADAVFLDDNLPNIVAAREFGMQGIHFESYEQAKAELDAWIESR